eukprot:jgi/Mesen1/574/ME000107S10816
MEINLMDAQWTRPQKIIGRRAGGDPAATAGATGGAPEVLVKWCGLSHEECTWESLAHPLIVANAHLVEAYDTFVGQAHQVEREMAALAAQANNNDADVAATYATRQVPRNRGTAGASTSVSSGGGASGGGSAGGKRGVMAMGKPMPADVSALSEQPQELRGGALFPHQLEALNWLRQSWWRRRNVILADEMGLGKTISGTAFLSSVKREFGAWAPCMVLVPLSTMPNWQAELALWAPHVNVVDFSRPPPLLGQVARLPAPPPPPPPPLPPPAAAPPALPSPHMVIADAAPLRAVPWECLVVDEGHRLKNQESRLFQLLNTLSFAHRVLLTGTPLQNNVGEMYNLLSFLEPDKFPSLVAFQARFGAMSTEDQMAELKTMVAPHMLRRLKRDAMQNIPPKQERLVSVELSSIQAEYYRALLTRNYQLLRQGATRAGQHQSLLNIVMQLRKVCNHPYLIPGTEPSPDLGPGGGASGGGHGSSPAVLQEMRVKASGKLALLDRMLERLHAGGHRVLIFSQMTKLLDILEDYLTVKFGHHRFERVDGGVSVADRQSAISRFNQDPSRFVFLLSTRACGLGINLASADTVIIYDSDFNPHADIQAMNRAHRIGQSKRLLVYRMVVRASVEERILQLAQKKLLLTHLFADKSAGGGAGGGAAGGGGGAAQKEVADILQYGADELFADEDEEGGDGDGGEGESAAAVPLGAALSAAAAGANVL